MKKKLTLNKATVSQLANTKISGGNTGRACYDSENLCYSDDCYTINNTCNTCNCTTASCGCGTANCTNAGDTCTTESIYYRC